MAEGGYDFVAEALFGGLEVDGFFLEYDDARSGRVRAAAVRAAGQARRPGAGDDEAAGTRAQGRPQAPHRRGVEVRPARAAGPVGAVRLLLDGRGQLADPRRADRQARADRGDRRGGVGLIIATMRGRQP